MKQFILCTVLTLFMLNSVILSAWASPCDHNQVVSEVEMKQGAMPCHKADDQEQSANHCDGPCFCAATCFYQTPIMKDTSLIYNYAHEATLRALTHDELVSRVSVPPHRPPIILS